MSGKSVSDESKPSQTADLVGFAAVLALVAATSAIAGPTDDLLDLPFPYEATETEVSQIASTLSARTSLPVRLSAEGIGPVTIRNREGSVRDLLDQLGSTSNLVWWIDGVAIHLEPRDTVTSRLVVVRGLPLDDIERNLGVFDLDDARFPLAATADAGVVRVGGPAGYVDAVAGLIETLVANRQRRTAGPASADPTLPRIFRGGRGAEIPAAAPAPGPAADTPTDPTAAPRP